MASYGHTVYLQRGRYVLRWLVDQFTTRKGYHSRPFERWADKAGAERFCRKWECDMPEEDRNGTDQQPRQ